MDDSFDQDLQELAQLFVDDDGAQDDTAAAQGQVAFDVFAPPTNGEFWAGSAIDAEVPIAEMLALFRDEIPLDQDESAPTLVYSAAQDGTPPAPVASASIVPPAPVALTPIVPPTPVTPTVAAPPSPVVSTPIVPPTPVVSTPIVPPTPVASTPIVPPTPVASAPIVPPTPVASAPTAPPAVDPSVPAASVAVGVASAQSVVLNAVASPKTEATDDIASSTADTLDEAKEYKADEFADTPARVVTSATAHPSTKGTCAKKNDELIAGKRAERTTKKKAMKQRKAADAVAAQLTSLFATASQATLTIPELKELIQELAQLEASIPDLLAWIVEAKADAVRTLEYAEEKERNEARLARGLQFADKKHGPASSKPEDLVARTAAREAEAANMKAARAARMKGGRHGAMIDEDAEDIKLRRLKLLTDPTAVDLMGRGTTVAPSLG